VPAATGARSGPSGTTWKGGLATTGPGGTVNYTWTPRGTLAASTVAGGPTTTLRSDAFDRQISDGSRSYDYDGLDRLASVTNASGTTPLKYDGTGPDPVSDGAFTYAHAPDGTPLSARATGASTVNSLLLDPHQNVLAGINGATGAVSDSRSYDPFGTVTASNGTHPTVGYQSGWTDPTIGKVNTPARWYDPAAGRFTARDSADPPVSAAVDTNRYAYAAANPDQPVRPDRALCRTEGLPRHSQHRPGGRGSPDRSGPDRGRGGGDGRRRGGRRRGGGRRRRPMRGRVRRTRRRGDRGRGRRPAVRHDRPVPQLRPLLRV
jgi:RHS repeat-associated protein